MARDGSPSATSSSTGELGDGAGRERCGEGVACSRVPVPVGVANVEAISAGYRFSLALSGGRVWAWGVNENGQLGNGTTTNSATPVPVSNISEVAAISAGEFHSLALLRAAGPAPPFEVVPGRGSLTVSWRAPDTREPWSISWRPKAHPVLKYEVVVRNKNFGGKIVTGTPLP